MEFSLGRWLWLYVEPRYAQKGGKVDFPSELDVADNTQTYDYLVVPVGLKAVAELGPVKPFGLVGFGLGFTVKNKTEFESGETVEDFAKTEDPDVTIQVGVGAEIPASEKIVFIVEGRYSLGVASISRDDSSGVYTRTVLVMGGISLRL